MKTTQAVEALSALAQPSRLEVFRLLAKLGEQGLCAGDISQQLNIPKPTLSFHLKELHQAKLIDSERQGRTITYRLNVPTMQHLLAFLSDDCCNGQPERCRPRQ
ncbi:helix-turn-helix transcriptional regulator [Verrucomicrobiaceae bacterium N1E253]|uniref:Helix-turn-helix transcriptional regulator n=1 Tax=Oceaniferula marina TaxID=2748318 RepID=A0A851GNK2_9BACT|nr:metalloregulator ArsR/SmtB family transcription factor [Oceaniferula marina]NWK55714.1 helix-turn-helix transcriptional regulator [Oceaniferula marina]